ncbi:MAG TPA: aminoglycoside phosphotransferase family protein [Anaerolineae bacterium]
MSGSADLPEPTASTAELQAALEQALSSHFDVPRTITGLERQPFWTQSSFALEELTLHLDDNTTVQLMFKDLSRNALLEGARRAKPIFLYNPLREIETYRTILARHQLGAATFYGAVVDEEIGRYWLFIEKVPGLELYYFGLDTWQEVARWLAAMHTRFIGMAGSLLPTAPLLVYDGDFYSLWLRRAQAFSRQPEQDHETQRDLEWLAGRYDQVVERLASLPLTFIHGEFYASNVLVQETEDGLRVCPIDWEMAAAGPGLLDLAALIAGSWTEEEKTTLALTYHEALAPGAWRPEPEAFLTALDYCRLHVAVQWLGWSADWTPPPEHTQNWHQEALNLAEKLGLCVR